MFIMYYVSLLPTSAYMFQMYVWSKVEQYQSAESTYVDMKLLSQHFLFRAFTPVFYADRTERQER